MRVTPQVLCRETPGNQPAPQHLAREPLDGSELLALLDEFSHDVRAPLTVVSEFANILNEEFLDNTEERCRAEKLIRTKAAEASLLIDSFELLIRTAFRDREPPRSSSSAAQILEAAARQLERVQLAATLNEQSLAECGPQEVVCNPHLASRTLVLMWLWMRRSIPRTAELEWAIQRLPPFGAVLLAQRSDLPIQGDAIWRALSPLARTAERQCAPTRRAAAAFCAARQLGRLAGGYVQAVGDKRALAMFIPQIDQTIETESRGSRRPQ